MNGFQAAEQRNNAAGAEAAGQVITRIRPPMRLLMKQLGAWLCASALVTESAFAQGFVNLNFESANLAPVAPDQFGGGYVPIADAVPGWSCAIDGSQVTQAINNNGTIGGSPSLSVWGERATNVGGVLQGNATVILSAGFGGDTGHTISLSQTGLIPALARSLLFKAAPYYAGEGSFSIFIGGQSLAYHALSTGSNYTLYGAIIPSDLAGTAQALTFTDTSFAGTWHYEKLDDIQFTSEPIPEPSLMSLAAISMVLVLAGSARLNKLA